MKVSVIIVSKLLRSKEAEDFKDHFKDLFSGKYIISGKYEIIGKRKYPLYYVGYLPVKRNSWIDGWMKKVDESKVLSHLR